MDLTKIKGPSFLKELTEKELNDLAKDIRQFIIESVSQTGGHLSSNLGIVELTIALHYVFNSPEDKIFFDVGHQCYVHKILTGRAKDFTHLRKFNGLSGFQKRSGEVDLEAIRHMDYARAKAELLRLIGVGIKVAECICLFALHHIDAFPVDTHIRQMLDTHYPKGFPLKRYKGFAGVMQQYAFYYELSLKG